MKRTIIFLIVMIFTLSLSGCATRDRDRAGVFPDFVRRAVANAPADVLVGVGNARLNSLAHSRTASAGRARAEIARQMNTMVEDMVRDYMAGSELDPRAAISFQEVITVSLSRAELQGASIVAQDRARDGVVWTVVFMGRENVAKEINQAQAAARLAVPAMASFDAEARMNEAFNRTNARERSNFW